MSRILLATAALLAAFVLHQVVAFSLAGARAEQSVVHATDVAAASPNEVETHLAQAKSVAEALKKKNLFTPAPPEQNPVREIVGILGSEVLIGGKWYKAGDRVGDAKILEVGPTAVRVSWNGREEEFSPLSSGGDAPGSGPPSGAGGRPERPERVQRRRERGRPTGPPGMTPEEQAALRERFRDASPEERAKLRGEMRERLAPPER